MENASEKPKRKVGIPFVKGDPRAGRPKNPEGFNEVQKLNKTKFIIAANKFLYMTPKEIQEALTQPDVTMIDLLVGGIIAKAAKESDTVRAAFILDRLIDRRKLLEEADPTLLPPMESQPATKQEDTGPVFVVEINTGGRFVRARPREQILLEATVNDKKTG